MKGDALCFDNTRVWNEMQAFMADTPAWTWISKYEGPKDGNISAEETLQRSRES